MANSPPRPGLAILGLGPSLGAVTGVFSIFLYTSLAVVAWMQTRWGALLVIAMGLLLFAYMAVAAVFFLHPELGPQAQQLLLALLWLTVPAFAFLSFRSLTGSHAPRGAHSSA